jgi:hypothetical protein
MKTACKKRNVGALLAAPIVTAGPHPRVRPHTDIERRTMGGHMGPFCLHAMMISTFMLIATGCIDLKSPSKVEEFRVLAVSADPPEIAPGEGTRLEVLWADPDGEGRDVSFAWVGCAGLLRPPAGLESCLMLMPPVVSLAEEGGDMLDIPATPPDLLSYAQEGTNYMKATFIILMCAGGELPAADEYESIGQVDDLSTLCDGGEGIAVYKTVTVSNNTENPERNPKIESLTLDGEPLLPLDQDGIGTAQCAKKDGCGAAIKLAVTLTDDSFQTYEVEEDGESATVDEGLYVSWFVTDGDVDAPTSASTTDSPLGPYETVWKPKHEGTFTLYVAAHDFRGGASFESFEVEVLPKE